MSEALKLSLATGGLYIQAFDGSVGLAVAGHRDDSHWTPLSVGLSPTGMSASLAAPDLAHVPRQPCPGRRRYRFLHRPQRRPACALCPTSFAIATMPSSPWQNPFVERLIGSIRRVSPRARPPSPACGPLQRDRAPHRTLDGPADRGRVPGRHRAILRSRVPATREGHGDRRSPDRGGAHRFGSRRETVRSATSRDKVELGEAHVRELAHLDGNHRPVLPLGCGGS
jgi:hypothetical protein